MSKKIDSLTPPFLDQKIRSRKITKLAKNGWIVSSYNDSPGIMAHHLATKKSLRIDCSTFAVKCWDVAYPKVIACSGERDAQVLTSYDLSTGASFDSFFLLRSRLFNTSFFRPAIDFSVEVYN